MATKLSKPVNRETDLKDINGVEGPVVVTIDAQGVSLRGKGKKRMISLSWTEAVKHMILPPNAPAKYTGNPVGWLINKD